MKKNMKLSESELIDLIKKITEEYDSSIDPCFERQVKFYQSVEGKELIKILGILSNVEGKADKNMKKRARQLMRLLPKC